MIFFNRKLWTRSASCKNITNKVGIISNFICCVNKFMKNSGLKKKIIALLDNKLNKIDF